jgi:hypothetical protein
MLWFLSVFRYKSMHKISKYLLVYSQTENVMSAVQSVLSQELQTQITKTKRECNEAVARSEEEAARHAQKAQQLSVQVSLLIYVSRE